MIQYILLFTLFFTISNVWAQKPTFKLAELRPMYLEASTDEEVANRFNKLMKGYAGKDPVVLGYKGASEAVMAKYVWNPYHKLKQLNTAAALFEQAVKLDPKNPEIRFLRFTVEHYVPRYLNLSQNLEADRKIILNSLHNHPDSGLPTSLARTIRDFMLTKDHISEEEKKILRTVDL